MLMSLLPEYAALHRQNRVLELGAGTGIYSRHLLQLGAPLQVASDISSIMLAQARQRLTDENIHYIQCRAECLPFADHSFSLVAAFACLHHVENTDVAFREVARVMMKDGILLLMEPNPMHPMNALLGLIRPMERGMLSSWPSRWRAEAQRARLQLITQRYGSFFPGWPCWLEHCYVLTEPLLARVPVLNRMAIFVYYYFQRKIKS